MELIVSNLVGKTRRATLNGKEYLVAPITMIVPGVLNGSKGALYYPTDELAKDPSLWNNVPIVVDHPVDNGAHVSARSPDVLDKSGIGYVFGAHITDNGSLAAEGWFDIQATKRVDNRIWEALQSGKPIGLSTGLFTDNEPLAGTFNGRNYDAVARNYRADHLAILVDKPGACSLNDGCGVMVNACSDCGKEECECVANNSKETILSKFWDWLTQNAFCPTGAGGGQDNSCSSKEGGGGASGGSSGGLKEMWSGGAKSMTQEKVDAGLESLSKLKGEEFKSAVKEVFGEKHAKAMITLGKSKTGIMQQVRQAFSDRMQSELRSRMATDADPHLADMGKRTAAAYGKKILGNEEADTYEDFDMATKQENISFLTANCDCWKGDEKTLNTFSDEKLAKLRAALEQSKQRETIANTLLKGVKIGSAELTFNSERGAVVVRNADGEECEPGDEKCEEMVKAKKEKPAMNQEKKAPTANEWLATAPPEIQSAVRNAMEIERRERQQLVQRLTANVADTTARTNLASKLLTKPLDELRDLVAILPPAPVHNEFTPEPDYSGAAGGVVFNAIDVEKERQNILPILNYDYAEEAKRRQAV